MKLIANRAQLLAAVSTVLHTAGSDARGLLAADADGATLTANGYDGGAVYTIDGLTVKEAGSAVFNLNGVAAVLRGSVEETVDLDLLPNGRIVLRTKSGRLELPTREAGSILAPPEADDYPSVEIPAAEFRRAVARVSFAADRRAKPASWVTTGVRFALAKDCLILEATDTIGLAMCRIEVKGKGTGESLLPVKVVRAWSEAARGQETTAIAFGPSVAVFRSGPLLAWAAGISGRYPPINDLFDKRRPNRMSTPPRELLAAAELSMVAADQDEGVVPGDRRLTLKVKPSSLEVSAMSESATARFQVKAAGYKGDQFVVELHGQRVVEYLSAIEDEKTVSVCWQNAQAAIEFSVGGSHYLAMPFYEREPARLSDTPATDPIE